MAVSITEKPYLIDFAGNTLAYRLSGTPVKQAGRKAVSKWKITKFPRLNYSLILRYGEKLFSFEIKNSGVANNQPHYIGVTNDNLKGELEKKIRDNYYISRDFEVFISDDLEIVFTSRIWGGYTVFLSTTDPQANLTNLYNTIGIEKIERSNYKVFARFEITRYLNGNVQEITTPEILLNLDHNNKTSLSLTILCSYFSQVDIPLVDESFGAHTLQYATLKYRLAYTDYFEGKIQVVNYSDYGFVVNGKLAELQKSQNLPDWHTRGNNKLSYLTTPLNYGSDTDVTVNTFRNLPQYAYFMLFNVNKNGDYASKLSFRVDILNKDGSTLNNIAYPDLEITNYNIIRVPIGIEALQLDGYSGNILSYTVRVFNPDTPQNEWKRTFNLQGKPYYAKIFLLQNKYGVLESFFIDHEAKEKSVEGDEIKKHNNTEIDITDISEVYTARTGYKSPAEMKLLAQAIENPFNFKIENNEVIPITILPDTLLVFDEAEDLQSAGFQYKYNIAGNSTGEKAGNNVIIDLPYLQEKWIEYTEAESQVFIPTVWVDNAAYCKLKTINSITKNTTALKPSILKP